MFKIQKCFGILNIETFNFILGLGFCVLSLIAFLFRDTIFRANTRLDPSPWIDNSSDRRPARLAGLDDVFKNSIHEMFVEDPDAAVRNKIIFEGFKFQTNFARTILYFDRGKVRQARLRADAGEFRKIQIDHVSAVFIFIVPDLDRWSL